MIPESEKKDPNSLQVPDLENEDEEEDDDEFAYENIQFEMLTVRAQPPRRYVQKTKKLKSLANKPGLDSPIMPIQQLAKYSCLNERSKQIFPCVPSLEQEAKQ